MIVDRFQYKVRGGVVFLQLNLGNKVERIRLQSKEQRFKVACTLITKRINALIKQRRYAFESGKIKFRSSSDSNLHSKALNNLEAQMARGLSWQTLPLKARVISKYLRIISSNTPAWKDLLQELDDLVAHPEQLNRTAHECNT